MNDEKIFKRESDLLTNIKEWNVRFPFDLTWRRKYNIPFCSAEHRNMCLFDIKFDIEENNLIENIILENIKERKNKELGVVNKQLLKSKVTNKLLKEEVDNAFEQMDLDSFDNMKI